MAFWCNATYYQVSFIPFSAGRMVTICVEKKNVLLANIRLIAENITITALCTATLTFSQLFKEKSSYPEQKLFSSSNQTVQEIYR